MRVVKGLVNFVWSVVLAVLAVSVISVLIPDLPGSGQ